MNIYHVRHSVDMGLFTTGSDWTVILAENEHNAEKNAIEKIKAKWKMQYRHLTGEDRIIHNIDIDIWEIKLLGENYTGGVV